MSGMGSPLHAGEFLETVQNDEGSNSKNDGIQWDVAEYLYDDAKIMQTKFCLLRAGAYVNKEGDSISF